MAAGDLENIIPTPSAARTVNINFCVPDGAVYSVKEVHYADASSVDHLIWKRDHEPTGTEYSDVFSTGQIMFKWTATSSTIDTVKIWCKNEGSTFNYCWHVYDSDGNSIAFVFNPAAERSTDTLKVDGSEITVNTLEVSPNCSVTPGNVYYIFAGVTYGSHWYPLVYKNETGDYWNFTGEDYILQQQSSISGYYTAYSDHLIKAEVNGEQV